MEGVPTDGIDVKLTKKVAIELSTRRRIGRRNKRKGIVFEHFRLKEWCE